MGSEAPTAMTKGSMAGLSSDAVLGAAVAGGGDDDDAVAPGVLDGGGERVDLVGLDAVGAVGEDHDPDVHAARVAVLDRPVDGGDDLRDVDGAVSGADPDVDDAGVGGEAAGRRRCRR